MGEIINNILADSSNVSRIIISIAFMIIAGFAMTRITKLLRLPNVTAYIVAGILIGPNCFNIVPQTMIDGMDFIADIALAFIAFTTGEFFRFNTLKKNGIKVLWITLFESLTASAMVFAVTYFALRLDITFSIVLSALAATISPASTMMTIRQTGAKGDFVDTLLQVVALDNVVGLIFYSIALSIASAASSGVFSLGSVISPVLINLGIMLLGGVFGFFLKCLMPKKRSTDNRLIISIAMLFTFCGICALLDVSPLLGCMSMGTIYINITDDDKLFKQLNYFSPPILLLFFVRSGLNFKLDALADTTSAVGSTPLFLVGILYFLMRIVGKYGGAYLGCLLTRKSKSVRNYLGLALIPQAGVAIGLAALGARALGGEAGSTLETIILASSVLCELIGPACAKLSLYLSGSYSNKLEDLTADIELPERAGLSEAEILIERIQAIQKKLPKRDAAPSEEEAAFTEAYEEQFAAYARSRLGSARKRM